MSGAMSSWSTTKLIQWISGLGLNAKFSQKIVTKCTANAFDGSAFAIVTDTNMLMGAFELPATDRMFAMLLFNKIRLHRVKAIEDNIVLPPASQTCDQNTEDFKLNMSSRQGQRFQLQGMVNKNTTIQSIKERYYEQEVAVLERNNSSQMKSKLKSIDLLAAGVSTVLQPDRTLGFYKIVNGNNLLTVRFNADGGTGTGVDESKVYHTSINDLQEKLSYEESSVYLSLSDAELPGTMKKKFKRMRLLYKPKCEFIKDLNWVSRVINEWRDVSQSNLVSFCIKTSKTNNNLVQISGELADLHAHVVKEYRRLYYNIEDKYTKSVVQISATHTTNTNTSTGSETEPGQPTPTKKANATHTQSQQPNEIVPATEAVVDDTKMGDINDRNGNGNGNNNSSGCDGGNDNNNGDDNDNGNDNDVGMHNGNDNGSAEIVSYLLTNPLEWNAKHVQEWFANSALKRFSSKYAGVNGIELFSMSKQAMSQKIGNPMLVISMTNQLKALCKEFKITAEQIKEHQELFAMTNLASNTTNGRHDGGHNHSTDGSAHRTNGKKKKNRNNGNNNGGQYVSSAVIRLYNQGNTCYMNSCLQALLQTPLFIEFLRSRASVVEPEPPRQEKQQQSSSWWPGSGWGSTPAKKQMKPKRTQSRRLLTLLDAFANLAIKANDGQKHTTPSQIRAILSNINPRFGNGGQDDTSVVMSTILSELDQNCSQEFMRDYGGSHSEPLSTKYSLVVKREMSKADEQTIIDNKILPEHNPYNQSIIRRTMDGVEKVVSQCLVCEHKKIEYLVFRSLQLSLINHQITLSVEIYIPELVKSITESFQVMSYCSVTVLKAQIVRCIAEKRLCQQLYGIENVIIGRVRKPQNTQRVDDYVQFFDDKTLVSRVSMNLFAVVDPPQQNLRSNNTSNNSAGNNNNGTWNGNDDDHKQHSNGDGDGNQYLMKFEVVLSAKGKPYQKPRNLGYEFICVQKGGKFNGKVFIDECRNASTRVSAVNKSSFNLQVFIGNGFVDPGKDYTFGGTNATKKTLVLVWTPRSIMKKTWNKRQIVYDQTVYQTAVFDNGHNNANLRGVVEQLRRRYQGVTQQQHAYAYTDAYKEKLTMTYVAFNGLLENNAKLMQFLKFQLEAVTSQQRTVQSVMNAVRPISDVESALNLYEQPIVLDDGRSTFRCKGCKRNAAVFSEKRTIVYAPHNLVLVIDRHGDAQSQSGKFTHLVRYPVCDDQLVFGTETKEPYLLFATCNHSSSSMSYGHYTANVRSINTGKWYYTSDSNVNEIYKNQLRKRLLDANAIVLLYTLAIPRN